MSSCSVFAETPTDAAYFFGYHDVTPWSPDDATVAMLRVNRSIKGMPSRNDQAEICLWHPLEGSPQPLARTTAWNWQIGARVQWLPGPKPLLIWNTVREDGIPASSILDLDTSTRNDLDFTVFAVAPDGRSALSPHYGRLARHWPAYGYTGVDAPGVDTEAPDDDGLWRIDLESGAVSLLVSVAQVANIAADPTRVGGAHFLAHPSYSPTGDRFVFMHRWLTPDAALYSRMFVADAEGGDIRLLIEEKVSHFDWIDDNRLIVWARAGLSALAAVRRRGLLANPIVRPALNLARRLAPTTKQGLTNEGYFLLSIDDPNLGQAVGRGVLDRDGHPMVSADGRWMLTDTYVDAAGGQTLILYDLTNNVRHDLARFDAATDFAGGDTKCDLHPRWNRSNTHVAVDTTKAGTRQLLLLDVTAALRRAT